MTVERPEHEASGKSYVVAFLAMLALWGLSFGLLTVFEWGIWSPAVALAIASVQLLIVAFVFMHLWEAAFASRIVALITIIFIVLICLGIVADVAFR